MSRTPPRRPALRRLFAWQFALVAALPLLLAGVLWAALAVPQALRDVDRDNQQTSALIRGQIEVVLSGPQRALQLAARLLDSPDTQALASRQVLQQTIDDTPAFEAVYLADAQGHIEAAALRSSTGLRASDLVGLDFSTRPYYQAARTRGTPVWSDTFLSPFTGQVTAALAVPCGPRLLVADMSLKGLADELRRHQHDSGTIIVVLDAKGRVIVHPQQQLANWQENMRTLPLVRDALQGRLGRGTTTLNGEVWLADAATAQPAGWTVLVAQPRSRVYGPLLRIAGVAALAVSVALALAITAALRLAHNVAERYRHLAAAAQAMVDGRPGNTEVDFGSEEGHALWERLRALLDQLQDEKQHADTARRDLQAVLDAATEVAVIATDTAGVIRLFNRGASKMLGWRPEELLGQAALSRLHDADEMRARADELAAVDGREVSGADVLVALARDSGYEVRDWTYVRRDGSRLLVSLAVTAVRDAQGRLTGFLHIAVDQTQRQRATALEIERERAEAASRAKSEFLSRVSHELRTPLNAMLGYVQLLGMDRREPLTPTQQERASRIETAGWHLLKLIDDVLDLSRIEAGQVPLATVPVDLRVAVADALRLMAPQAQAQQVHLVGPEADAPPAWVQADATRLKQVLVNLLSNAVKYNHPEGEVRIDIDSAGRDGIALHVIDTGHGIASELQQRLFSPFDRIGMESSDIPGTGLGLVITKRLVELMRGRIEVESLPGEGSRFTVVLPVAAGSAAPLDATAPAAAPDPGVCGTVVYVEDNAMNAALMREVFAMRPRCELVLCETLHQGRETILALRPALVLVDMHLGDGSGLDLLQWLRSTPALRDVPAVVVSADATRGQQDSARAAGATDYLTKPIRIDSTLQVIDRLLQR